MDSPEVDGLWHTSTSPLFGTRVAHTATAWREKVFIIGGFASKCVSLPSRLLSLLLTPRQRTARKTRNTQKMRWCTTRERAPGHG